MSNKVILTVGAAGNKAGIELIEQGVIPESKVLLINSTMRDIPDKYRHLGVCYEEGSGCGKQRNLAAELCLQSIKEGELGKRLDSFINPNDDQALIISSTEGGTGSGSTKILAKYITQVLGLSVHCFAFTGFNTDSRGLQNTIEYFQDMSSDYIVQAISNKKFLNEFNNIPKAEKAANLEFVERVKILIADGIVDSEQNIDETDMYKVTSTPGYMISGKILLNKIKNIDQFNKAIINMIDENKSLETDKSVKRLAVFLNINESTRDHIDYSFNIFKERYGTPYEIFTHIQYDDSQPEYVSFIASGMNMPLEEVKDVYKKYTEESEKVNKKKDDFFSFASGLRGNEEDSMFNMNTRKSSTSNIEQNKDSFFNEFKVKDINEANKTIDVNKIVENAKKEVKTKEQFMNENF